MAANLIEAIEEWIGSQTSITGLFAGGTSLEDAPPEAGEALPSLAIVQRTSRIVNIVGSSSRAIQYLEVDAQIQAIYAEDARRLAGRVRDLILSGGTLTWSGGREVGRYQADGEGGELEEGIGPDGSDVWVHRIPLVFCTVRD
jgi:hypothetical protein